MKKGDRVVCIDNKCGFGVSCSLVLNKIYDIYNCVEYKGMLFIEVLDDSEDIYGGVISYNSCRFKLLQEVRKNKLKRLGKVVSSRN